MNKTFAYIAVVKNNKEGNRCEWKKVEVGQRFQYKGYWFFTHKKENNWSASEVTSGMNSTESGKMEAGYGKEGKAIEVTKKLMDEFLTTGGDLEKAISKSRMLIIADKIDIIHLKNIGVL